jgi:FkbM family methyltransferase
LLGAPGSGTPRSGTPGSEFSEFSEHAEGTELKRKLKSMIKRWCRSWGYRVERLETHDFLDPLLNRKIQQRDQFFVIQIGANDGVSFDTLYAFVTENSDKIRGIMVEPLRDIFEELAHNYRDFPNLVPVNAAIHNTEKEMTLYRVDPEKRHMLPEWAKGIASFDRDFHKLSNTPAEYMIEEKVQCMNFTELLERHDFQRVDLLQIDTEGYDCEIIRGIDFGHIKPEIIYFEHGRRFNTTNKEEFAEILELLQSNGYYIMLELDDVVAYLHDLTNF